MLPLIRSGIHLPTPPTPSTITRTGIYPLIDRGFMPPSADFTPLLAPIDLSHWNVSLSIPPSTVRPFLRHFKKKLHDVGWRNIRPDLQTPVTGLYRPALHLIDPPHNPPPQIASAHSTPHIPQPRSPPPTASSRQPLHQSSEQLTFSQSFTDLSAPPDESCVPTVPIKDGRVMVESPGYCYLRERAGERWEKVRWVLEKVEEFVRNWDAQIFARRWKIKKVRRRLAQIMEAQYQNVHLKRYNRILTTYKRDEGQIMAHRRVIVMLLPSRHPGSLDPFPDVGVGRTFLLADPTVDLVFVTPLLDEERINYFRHMMSTTFPTSNPLTSPIRLRFIIPEAARCFKENSSLASMVVASRRAVREIRKMCKGRNAILCGVDRVEMAEVELSSIVNIPLYAPAPNAYSTYLSSRSATRALLKEAGCPLLPCIVSQAETEDDFVADVVSAVLGNREASVWMLWGEGSKGVDVPDACLDPTSPHISHLFQSSRPTTPLAQPSPVSRPKTPFTEHLKKAKHSLPSAIRLLHPMAPRTWKGFVSKWLTLSTGCKFDGKDMTMRFIRPELPAGMKHFDNAKFVDMTKARKTFHNVKLPTIDPIENRVACYVFGAEHHLVTDHGRRVLFGCAIKGGEVFDEWIDYKGVARTDENAVAANNFMPIATRLLSEHLLFHPQATRPNLPDPLMMTFPVQKALQDLGLIPKSSTPSIPNSRLQTAQTTSRPTSRLQPYQPTRPLTAQTPSLSTDLESLLQPFISLPPATLYSTPIPSKPAGPTFQISAETQEILLQGIPSMHAASHDSTFRRPVISPPYSRRASAERAKKSEGRNKRARTLLAKMEEEFERGRPVGSRKGKKPKVTIAVAENDLETSKPIKKEQSIGTRVKAAIEAVKAEAEELEASEKKIEKLGLGERRPFVDEPRASVLDDRTDFEISKALMRLQEVRSGEEELGVGERIEEARRAVEERHRRVLEDVERKGVGGGGIGGTQVTEDTPKNREIMRQLSVPAVLPERGRRLADIMGGGADRNWDRVGAVGGVGGGMSRRGSRRPSQIEERRISALASEAIGALLDDMQEEV
ncbi:hypothetical protein HK097_005230 [Rhizophlyctis rosea]|uniref:Uncharacterized protein n=1 Tax=Rhizophlyctis rosea TaxID=64517 RepID=A0AAD5X6W8_9FUNG|nr:hypothetical protein HK097_005230 [Rhizophlyctis rosea]